MNRTQSDENRQQPAGPRCDDYEEYLAETRGYSYDARDIVTIETLRRHDALRTDPAEALDDRDLELDDLDDFERLGAARGWLRRDEPTKFWEAIQPVLEEPEDNRAVSYADAHLWVAGVLADAGKYEAARRLVGEFADQWPDDPRGRQMEARFLVETDGPEAARKAYEQLVDEFGEEVELLYEIAEDLEAVGATELAREWLERTRERAEELGDRAILVDLELLEQELEDG